MEITKKIKIYEITTGSLLFFIPLILATVDGWFRPSISNYAYSNYSQIFVCLLTLGGCLFLFNALVNNKHWYNFLIGIALIIIGITPHLDFPVIHYVASGIFFLASLLAIPLSSSKKYIKIKFAISGFCIGILGLHFITGVYSLLIAEWVAILPISTHFIIKSINWKGII